MRHVSLQNLCHAVYFLTNLYWLVVSPRLQLVDCPIQHSLFKDQLSVDIGLIHCKTQDASIWKQANTVQFYMLWDRSSHRHMSKILFFFSLACPMWSNIFLTQASTSFWLLKANVMMMIMIVMMLICGQYNMKQSHFRKWTEYSLIMSSSICFCTLSPEYLSWLEGSRTGAPSAGFPSLWVTLLIWLTHQHNHRHWCT